MYLRCVFIPKLKFPISVRDLLIRIDVKEIVEKLKKKQAGLHQKPGLFLLIEISYYMSKSHRRRTLLPLAHDYDPVHWDYLL